MISPAPDASKKNISSLFSDFLVGFNSTLKKVFGGSRASDRFSASRGVPTESLSEIMALNPLSVGIPAEFGGRGGGIHETLAVLEACSYESLPLSLTLGINWALFLQPLAKFGQEEVKKSVFGRFLDQKTMGGLMITEPGHGTDALNMQTSFANHGPHYHVAGTKHWGGLTGQADFWLIAAREKTSDGNLKRDIGFFVCETTSGIVVEEYFESLGLYQIPYGRNRIDLDVPTSHRLTSDRTGVAMMLDTLHRSRMQFPGMGQGFLKRMLDEALRHCRDRSVGGRTLLSYDKVQDRLARLQAAYTVCSAMCVQSSTAAATSHDLAGEGIEANTIKTVVTDLMQSASQSLLQLVGAKGYSLDHVAGRATVDSRPFQIFEGSNDVLYAQISESILKLMGRLKESNLFEFLSRYKLTARASEPLKKLLNFRIDLKQPQRKLVDLGRAIGRIISFEWVLNLGDLGFRTDLITSGLAELSQQISGALHSFTTGHSARVVESYEEQSSWLALVQTTRS